MMSMMQGIMHTLMAFLGPKATPAYVVLLFLIAPVAIWHYVHLAIHIWKNWRKEENPSDGHD